MIKKTYIPGKPRNPKLGAATGTSGVGKTEFNQVAGSSHEHYNKGVLDQITEAMLVGAMRDLITSTDIESELTDENILSALRVLSEISKANADLLEDIKAKFLSKIEPDTAQKLIKFVEGVEVGTFTTGALGSGAAVKMVDGTSYAEVDNLTVRQKATFRELIIESLKHIGGQLVLTPARMKCVRVVDGGTYYKCYFDTGDGEVSNEFVAGDLARCQVFTGSGTKFYWRLVTLVGEDWINLSKTSAAEGSDAPEAGDDIAQLGNATDTTRQSAIILSTVGIDAPSWKQYSGINSFSLEGKETTVFTRLGNRIQGKTVFTSGGTNLEDALDGVGSDIQDAIVKATYWSIKASTPVIYKDAINAATSGTHTPVTVNGELRSGTTTTQGGFISIQPNGGAESTATASPRTIAPANGDGKTSYTVRLYDTASKTTLLDTQTIPVVFKGASGVNAINAILSNEADVLPASPEGVVSDYTGSGTIIRVFEGATESTYGTGNGQYQVSAVGSGITVGTPSTSGNRRVYGVASNMTADNATITFTITGKTASGASFSLTKVQAFAKSRTGADGDDGKDGDGNAHIYRHSLLKPATPTSGVANPTGWVKSPDKGISTPIPTNWTLKDKWYQSEELTTLGTTSISVISFTTTLPNQVVVLELWADGYASYDYIYAGKLNIGVTTSNYYDRVTGGKKVISYDVPSAGSHSIQIMWRKGIATIRGSNRGHFAIIKDVKVWRSTTAIINKIYQSWSSPEEYYPDSSTEETIYCLSKTETPPLISDSAAYIDEYLPLPCALSSYRGDFSTNRSYAIAQVVVYSGEYYKIIKAVPSNYTGNPTNAEYFENIKGWTDNAKGATKAFPFEYRSKRKKSGGVWGAFSASTVDGRWVEDGDDGRGVSSVVTWYYKSSSATHQQGGSWSTTKPSYSTSFYLWIKTITTYTDNSTSETTPIIDPDWHKVMAITDKFGTTVDGGLISTVMMLLRELNSSQDTAGFSGVRGALFNLPSYWSGGNYAKALAFVPFVEKLENDETTTLEEYNNLPHIVFLHNGAGKIGDFIIEQAGRIVLINPETGERRIIFSTGTVPTAEDLENQYSPSDSVTIGSGTTQTSVVLSGSTVVQRNASIGKFSGVFLTLSATGKAQVLESSIVSAKVYLRRNGERIMTVAQTSIMFELDVLEDKFESIMTPPLSFSVFEGTYTLELAVEVEGDAYGSATSGQSTFSWEYSTIGVKRFEFGKNGFMSWFENNAIHFSADKGLYYKGQVDMPGGLGGGSSSSGGTSNSWGKVTSASRSGSTTTINHSIGDTKYTVWVTPVGSSSSWHISSKNTNSVQVVCSGTFDYILVRTPY